MTTLTRTDSEKASTHLYTGWQRERLGFMFGLSGPRFALAASALLVAALPIAMHSILVLIVAWPVDLTEQEAARQSAASARQAAELASAPVIGDVDRPGLPMTELVPRNPRVRVAVPADIEQMLVQEEARALAWREASRQAFEAAWTAGYRVGGFRFDPSVARGFYLLSRAAAP